MYKWDVNTKLIFQNIHHRSSFISNSTQNRLFQRHSSSGSFSTVLRKRKLPHQRQTWNNKLKVSKVNRIFVQHLIQSLTHQYTYIHTHTRLTALCPGLPGWAGTRKQKTIWILLKQETTSGSGISWAIYKPAPCSRQITTPAPHHSVFTGQMPFLLPNQQRQSTERQTVVMC